MKKKIKIGLAICFIALAAGWVFKLYMPCHEQDHSALPPNSFYSFTLTESNSRIPCFQTEIEGIPFLAKLDTGYDGVLSLPKYLLEQLTNKCDGGTVFFTGIRGKKYESSMFNIPKLYIENVALRNLPAKEAHPEFEYDASLRADKNLEPSDLTARIGWWTFLGTILLIDLQKSAAICCDSLKTLEKKGYSLAQFISTDLLSSEHLLEFEANIDNRVIKCLLDTGSSLNLIQASSSPANEEPKFGEVDFANPPRLTQFSIGGRCLGPCEFYETQLPFGAEAIIGIDFLETQIVCIDFISRKLFLCPAPEDNSPDSEIPQTGSSAL